jgi:hypothetical protein
MTLSKWMGQFRVSKRANLRQDMSMVFRRGLSLVAVATLCSLVLTGCAQSSQQYGSDSKDGVYFAVPNSWHQISSKDLNHEESLSTAQGAAERLALVHYQVAFSVNPKVTAKQVLSLTAPDEPVVYTRVRGLTSDEIQQVSYNDLRNLVLPLSTWEDGTATSVPVYSVDTDEEAVQKGGRGVHTIFSFTSNGVSQTLNQTGLLSNDHHMLVMLIARCTTTCYTKNKSLIEKIVKSFTFRGSK